MLPVGLLAISSWVAGSVTLSKRDAEALAVTGATELAAVRTVGAPPPAVGAFGRVPRPRCKDGSSISSPKETISSSWSLVSSTERGDLKLVRTGAEPEKLCFY